MLTKVGKQDHFFDEEMPFYYLTKDSAAKVIYRGIHLSPGSRKDGRFAPPEMRTRYLSIQRRASYGRALTHVLMKRKKIRMLNKCYFVSEFNATVTVSSRFLFTFTCKRIFSMKSL